MFFNFPKRYKPTIVNEKEFQRIKDTFELAYNIATAWGREYKMKLKVKERSHSETYFNYTYKNKIIEISSFNETKTTIEGTVPFCNGRHCKIIFKGKTVFDILVLDNNQLHIFHTETGEWEKYFFSVLRKRVIRERKAREIGRMSLFVCGNEKSSNVVFYNMDSSEFGKHEYILKMKGLSFKVINHFNNHKYDKISYECTIIYRSEIVFDVVAYYTKQHPFQTAIDVKTYKNGKWEQILEQLYFQKKSS